MGEILHMLDHAPVRCGDKKELAGWLRAWADELESHTSMKSLVLIVEDERGDLAVISQSVENMDCARTTGLMQMALHYRLECDANIEDMME